MSEKDIPTTPPPKPSEEKIVTEEKGLPAVDETPPTPPVKPPKDTN